MTTRTNSTNIRALRKAAALVRAIPVAIKRRAWADAGRAVDQLRLFGLTRSQILELLAPLGVSEDAFESAMLMADLLEGEAGEAVA